MKSGFCFKSHKLRYNQCSVSELFSIPEGETVPQISVEDTATLETLIRTYYPVLCRFAEKFLPDASLAKDVVQESFIKLWKSAKSFDSIQALKAYLYTATRNGCLDLIRSRSRLDSRHQQSAAGKEESAELVFAAIVQAESIALIYQAIKSMPVKMQRVFILSYREGMSVSEISAELGMNLKAVKKQKYKALVALRGQLSQRQQPLVSLLSAAALLHESGLS